ncbi:MAG: HNH endonuclease signature motif containing protein [Alphaproteobacteria bacterium]
MTGNTVITPELTQERLRELLDYDPKTGVFTWAISAAKRIKVGQVAGVINDQGYVVIKIDGRMHRAHRLAFLYMTGAFPVGEIDHEDRNRSNNRWGNLREATGTQNQGNTGIRSNNSSGHKGVSWSRKNGKWLANICVNGRTKHLGLFEDVNDAAAAYARAAEEYFGDFAHAPTDAD